MNFIEYFSYYNNTVIEYVVFNSLNCEDSTIYNWRTEFLN